MTSPVRTAEMPVGRLTRWRRSLCGSGGVRLLVALVGGFVTYLAYAPSTQWWTAIVGLGLLGASVHGLRGRAAFGVGSVFGAALFVPMLSWTGIYVGSVPWLALAVAEALLVGVPVIVIAWAVRLPGWPFFAAAAWVAGETLRFVFPFGGFGWGSVAFAQADGPLLPSASLLGAAGLSLMTAIAGFSLTPVLRWAGAAIAARRGNTTVPKLALLIPVLGLVISFGVGQLGRLTTYGPNELAGTSTAPIAVIQGNVPEPGLEFNARRRAVTDMHAQRTHELAAEVRAGTAPQPALVLWPENSSDIDPYTNADAAQVISAAADDIGVPILVGAVVGTDQPRRNLNMGIVWYPNTGPGETYAKRHPVPFAEYMPMRGFFRLFSDKVDLLTSEFLPGTRPGNFVINGVAIGDLICFEIVEDPLVRDVLAGGAQVLVVQTNNATFGWTNETYQQQAMSRVRAVEHGREVLISATSGVSAVIRPDGSVESRVPLFTPGYLVPNVPLIDKTTPGTVLGAPIEWTATATTPVALVLLLVVRRRQRTKQDAPQAGDQPQEESQQ